jgi:hypothetical protein
MPSGRTWIVVTAVTALVAGGGAAFLLTRGDDGPRPGTYRGERTSALYAPIATRALDPRPLTEGEVFGPRTASLSAAGVTLVRRSVTVSAGCAAAVWGAGPQAAVAGCTQALRAVYSTAAGDVSGQFQIFNLPDGRAADALVTALNHDGSGFARLAPGQPKAFDAVRSWAQVRALGHYVTLSWVGPVGDERPDLTGAQLALDGLSRALQTRVVEAG